MRSCLLNEDSMPKLIGQEGEEDLLLVEGFDGRQIDVFGSFDELVGLCHVEDEFVADEFGGSIVDVGTEIHVPAQGGEDHGDALDVDGHTEYDGVEFFAEHADEGWIRGLEMMPETLFLFGRECELAWTREQ